MPKTDIIVLNTIKQEFIKKITPPTPAQLSCSDTELKTWENDVKNLVTAIDHAINALENQKKYERVLTLIADNYLSDQSECPKDLCPNVGEACPRCIVNYFKQITGIKVE